MQDVLKHDEEKLQSWFLCLFLCGQHLCWCVFNLDLLRLEAAVEEGLLTWGLFPFSLCFEHLLHLLLPPLSLSQSLLDAAHPGLIGQLRRPEDSGSDTSISEAEGQTEQGAQFVVLPDTPSASEASDLQTGDLPHPRCPIQRGSTLQSGVLGGGRNTSEQVPKVREVVQVMLPTCGVVQPRSVPLVLLGLLVCLSVCKGENVDSSSCTKQIGM